MASKFIMFVAFASLAQFSVVQSSTNFYALAEEQFDLYIDEARDIFKAMVVAGNGTDQSVIDNLRTSAFDILIKIQGVFYKIVIALHPNATEAVESSRKQFPGQAKVIIDSFFSSIEAAQTADEDYDKALEKITSIRNNVVNNLASGYGDSLYSQLRNNQELDETAESEFMELKDEANDMLKSFAKQIFDAAEVVAKAINAGEETEDEYNEIRVFEFEAILIRSQFVLNLVDAAKLIQSAQTST